MGLSDRDNRCTGAALHTSRGSGSSECWSHLLCLPQLPPFLSCFWLFFETGLCYIAQAGPEVTAVLLLQPPETGDDRHTPSSPSFLQFSFRSLFPFGICLSPSFLPCLFPVNTFFYFGLSLPSKLFVLCCFDECSKQNSDFLCLACKWPGFRIPSMSTACPLARVNGTQGLGSLAPSSRFCSQSVGN